MALTGMQVYKSLPKTNCKDCGLPTCLAFAMQVAAKQRALTDCPHLSEDALAEMAEASSPPMKLVSVGSGEKKFEIGQETVMFRHEEKFHRSSGIAVRVPGDLSDDEAVERVKAISALSWVRVGTQLNPAMCAVDVDGCADPAARARRCEEAGCLPLVIVSSDPSKAGPAVEAIKDAKPLIYGATPETLEGFADIASSAGVPLAITAGSLEDLADLAQKAKDKGVEELILAFRGENIGDTVRNLTVARRAALKKGFRILGFPAMVEVVADTPELETVRASIFAAKYAGIVLINGFEPWELLPILTTVQDVYIDPQVPNIVEAKLYEIGNPDENSPVLYTTNFSLTYFSVAGEVERSKVPTYICVVDTEGLGVLNAYAGDKISAEKVVKTLQEQKVADKVTHRKLIIPGLIPMFRAEIEDTSEWKEVIIGPETAREIPAFLASNWG